MLGCLGQLDEAAAAGLVESTATPGEHRFVHVLLRDAIEAGLGTDERVQLHRSAAEAVEELYAGRLAPRLSDLARLYRLALDVGGGERDDLDRCQLLLALGAAQSLSGDHPGRLQTCRCTADLARSMARPDLIAEAALTLDGGDGAEADRLVRRLC